MEKLKEIRKNKKFTQKDVAQKLNISQQTYSDYENGKSEPNIDVLKKLSKLFNISIDNLVDNNISKLSNCQIELINKIKNCNDKTCEKLLSYLDGLKSKD